MKHVIWNLYGDRMLFLYGGRTMNKLPEIGDFLYAESGNLTARHLEVIEIESKKNESDSLITVVGKYGRKYKEPLWMFTGVE